jgi:hypothetical protein
MSHPGRRPARGAPTGGRSPPRCLARSRSCLVIWPFGEEVFSLPDPLAGIEKIYLLGSGIPGKNAP